MNGTQKLISLFKDEDSFIQHFIKSCYFIEKDGVEKRAVNMFDDLDNGKQLPVRFTFRLKGKFQAEGKRFSNKNKNDIRKLVKDNNFEFIDKENGNIPVFIDGTGNQSLVQEIGVATNYLISTANCDFINYTISHIWEKTTYNPYFFSSLWNVAIIPCYLNYIMDKPRKQDEINEKIQGIMKAICIELYNPDQLMKNRIKLDKPKEEYVNYAKKAIKENWIKYLPKKKVDITKITFSEELEKHKNVKNKDFIFGLLDLMTEYNLIEDAINSLTDESICKDLFNHYRPILVIKKGNKQNIDEERYYSGKYFKFQSQEYYVTNDWYKKDGKNKRENRNLFLNWIDELLNQNV